MSDFVEVVLDDGNTRVLFQTAESDLVRSHGGEPDVGVITSAMNRLESIASATQRVASSFKENVKPDELTLEIAIGLSGEVGWFFAKSELESSMTVTLTWKSGS
ncbi:MAG: hypothetical protein J0I49_22910 [Pseudonocardia sp.]|uniref:CU044_2847 family protein n=1 Tax=Pseudonocardia sp. TaxID=60912 RepID=UPI001AC71438|nr:CU044_2847 family protein [Pseudonocardia sp.]MBN9100936.1 hypothetical protein [Pseudonocardia sp.]